MALCGLCEVVFDVDNGNQVPQWLLLSLHFAGCSCPASAAAKPLLHCARTHLAREQRLQRHGANSAWSYSSGCGGGAAVL